MHAWLIYLGLPKVGWMVVETCIDPDPFNSGPGVRCEWGESGEHLLDIGAEEVAPNFHPWVGDTGAIEGPLVQMRVVMAESVGEVAAVNMILIPASYSYSSAICAENIYQSVS